MRYVYLKPFSLIDNPSEAELQELIQHGTNYLFKDNKCKNCFKKKTQGLELCQSCEEYREKIHEFMKLLFIKGEAKSPLDRWDWLELSHEFPQYTFVHDEVHIEHDYSYTLDRNIYYNGKNEFWDRNSVEKENIHKPWLWQLEPFNKDQ